ncbi:hypothetical protein I4U23_029377 [Adineta vaga]|nr:hypothetical protein I4U23_029377 [Adineta vaga]
MKSKKISLKRTSHPTLICLVCGDIARGMNFEVITCMSCKAFFRRHAAQNAKEFQCLLNNDCIITQQTRGACSACRLKKCLSLGMNPKLIRVSAKILTSSGQRQQRESSNEEEQISILPQPTTISLLNKDRSTLTFDEWNTLSNVIHIYDEQNLIIRTQCLLREHASLPLKIRSKKAITLDLVVSFYTAIEPLLQRSPCFNNLSSDVRRVIVQNNLNGVGALNSMFAALETKIFDNPTHLQNCYEIYGEEYVKENRHLLARLDQNGTLIKIMMLILAFSTNCSLVSLDKITTSAETSTASSIILMRIQDMFIVILWKYLIYQYGFLGAVRRLDHLVKFYLELLLRMNDNSSREHDDMINVLIDKTTHSLTKDD